MPKTQVYKIIHTEDNFSFRLKRVFVATQVTLFFSYNQALSKMSAPAT